MESEIKVVRRTRVQREKRRTCRMAGDSVKRCRYKMGPVVQVFKSYDSFAKSTRVKKAYGEIKNTVVKLSPVFCDGICEMKNCARDIGIQ